MIDRKTYEGWKDQPILHDEDDWSGKYKTYGEMWEGEGYDIEKPEQPEEQPTADQETTFEIYDEEIAQAETLEKIAELEAVINSNFVLGLLTATQREALEGACVYMEQQLKAGKKPEEIKHRNGGKKDAV